jgi:hypothetical protein
MSLGRRSEAKVARAILGRTRTRAGSNPAHQHTGKWMEERGMKLLCRHKWIEWPGLCDDWGGSVRALVCVKCWKHKQQTCHGRWREYGYLDPNGAWARDIVNKTGIPAHQHT